jgi:hypothetical protein
VRARTPLIWLAVRLAFGRRDRLGTSVVLGVAVAVTTVLALATAAAPHVAAAQSQRAFDRTATLSDSTSAAAHANLLQLDPHAWMSDRRWDGHVVERSVYARRGEAVPIPGIAAAPAAGSYFASPDLVSLIRADPVVRALYAGKRFLGLIGPAGLVQPHELRSIEGVSAETPLLDAVTGFGAHPEDGAASTMLNVTVTMATLIAIWAPALVLLIMVSRLSLRARSRRAHILRLQGLSIGAVRTLLATEVAAVALPAGVVGLGIYALLTRHLTELPGTPFGFYAADARLPAQPALSAAVAVVAVVTCSAAFSVPMQPDEPVVLRREPARVSVVVGLAALAVGLVYLLALPMFERLTSHAALGIWISIALILVGLGLAGPRVVMYSSRWAAERAKSAGTVVGLRLNSWLPTTAMRLGTLLGILVVPLLGIVAFTHVLSGGATQAWAGETANDRPALVTAYDLTGQLNRADVAAVAHGHAAAEATSLRISTAAGPTRQQTVIFASCHDLTVLLGRPVTGCVDAGTWLAANGAHRSQISSGRLRLGNGTTISVPPAAGIAQVTHAPASFDGALLLPPRDAVTAPQRQPGTNTVFYARVAADRIDSATATLSGRAPTAQFDLGALQWSWPGNEQFRSQYQWLVVGIVTGLVLGAVALLTATLGEGTDRRRRLRGMHRLGAPLRATLSAHFWSTASAPLLLGWAGTAIGWLVCRSLHRFDDRAYVSGADYRSVVVIVAAIAFMIATLTATDARSPKTSPDR